MQHQFFISLCLVVSVCTTHAMDDERKRAIEELESQGVPSTIRTSLLPDLTSTVREKIRTEKALPIIQQSQIRYFQKRQNAYTPDDDVIGLSEEEIKDSVQDSWNNHSAMRLELREQLQHHNQIIRDYYIQRIQANLEAARGIIPTDLLNWENPQLLEAIAAMDFSMEDSSVTLAGKLLRLAMTVFHNPELLISEETPCKDPTIQMSLYFRNTSILYLLSARAYRYAMREAHGSSEELTHGLSALQVYSYAQACARYYTRPAQKEIARMTQALLKEIAPQLLLYQALPMAEGLVNDGSQTYGEKARQILKKMDWTQGGS